MEQSFNREIKISFEEIHNRLNLPREIIVLFNKAEQALENAYAPYSKFKVGSSLLLGNGSYIIGNNQENASFPNGICSERVALFSAKANYPDLIIKKIAITCLTDDFIIKQPIAPCGMCRQVLLEYEEEQNSPIEVWLFTKFKILKFNKAKDLLPLYFNEDRLKKKN